jgi:predicted  nucleic acid-binding Zn-ribbon protein
MSDEERIKRVEEAVLTMKDLLVRHEERLDEHDERIDDHNEKLRAFYKAMEDSREDFNFKLNALIDAQIRNESDITTLKDSTKELKEASELQLKRIENLENN